MGLIKSVVEAETKVCPGKITPGLPGFLTCSGIRVSPRRGEAGDANAETEARKCFPSIVASAGENSL